MITLKPRPAAAWANATISIGVRWAESTRTSLATPSSARILTAGSIVGRSESLPMITATVAAGPEGLAVAGGTSAMTAGHGP
jgi:hypothetical protein